MIICCSTSLAQISFLEFVNSVDWNWSEGDIVNKYVDITTSSLVKGKRVYTINGIMLCDKDGVVYINTDSITGKINSLTFKFKNSSSKNSTLLEAKNFSNEIDNCMVPILGNPDILTNKLDSKYMKELNRVWYEDKYIVQSETYIFSDSYVNWVFIKRIDDSIGFRDSKWGDSKATVLQKEGRTNLSSHSQIYMFSDNICGLDCSVIYVFTNDKLTMGKYVFTQTHSNQSDYIIDYNSIIDLMINKYGVTKSKNISWSNSLYKTDYEKHGFAISIGHLSFDAWWSTNNTDIIALLYGENYDIKLILQYTSKQYDDLREADRNKRMSDGL